MNLRQKYDHAIQVAKSVRMQGAAEERDGKLHFNGVVNSEDEKNQNGLIRCAKLTGEK